MNAVSSLAVRLSFNSIECVILEKTQVPHQIDETFDESLYRRDNPHLTSRFCKDKLGPKFQHGIRACRIQEGKPKSHIG